MENRKVLMCLCRRCGWEWLSRLGIEPLKCARCKSSVWKTERKPRSINPFAGEKRFPQIWDLGPGENVFIPCPDPKTRAAIQRTIIQVNRKTTAIIVVDWQWKGAVVGRFKRDKAPDIQKPGIV